LNDRASLRAICTPVHRPSPATRAALYVRDGWQQPQALLLKSRESGAARSGAHPLYGQDLVRGAQVVHPAQGLARQAGRGARARARVVQRRPAVHTARLLRLAQRLRHIAPDVRKSPKDWAVWTALSFSHIEKAQRACNARPCPSRRTLPRPTLWPRIDWLGLGRACRTLNALAGFRAASASPTRAAAAAAGRGAAAVASSSRRLLLASGAQSRGSLRERRAPL